jgi:hypothetical protein
VPGNGLSLPIRVGREDQLVGALQCIGDILDPFLRLWVHFPGHGEVLVRADRPILGRQVADMTEAGQHPVTGAQVLVDRLHFAGRLDDEDVHGCFK